MARLKPISGATGHILRAAGFYSVGGFIRYGRAPGAGRAVSRPARVSARLGALRVARVSEQASGRGGQWQVIH